jgi:hypothetical protein
VELIVVAADRLAVATDLLAWVRGESPRPMGIPELAGSIEHLEGAAQAMRAARECVLEYLVALGLSASAEATSPEFAPRPISAVPGGSGAPRTKQEKIPPLRRWWAQRIEELIDSPEPTAAEIHQGTQNSDARAAIGNAPPGDARRTASPNRIDHRELLRRVGDRVRDNDKQALRRELRDIDPPVGLALSAICPAELRELMQSWLGRQPTAEDLPRLRELSERRVRELLPGLPQPVLTALLQRVCRVSSEHDRSARRRSSDQTRSVGAAPGTTRGAQATRDASSHDQDDDPSPPAHPTDSAVASAVLVGILADRVRRDPATLGHQVERRDD